MSNLTVWFTPIWLIAVGTTIGALVVLATWVICLVLNRRWASAIQQTVSESVLLPITYALVALAALALIAMPIMPMDRLVNSLKRLPYVGQIEFSETVPANTEDFKLTLPFRADELQGYTIESEQELAINVEEGKGFAQPLLLVEAAQDSRINWSPTSELPRGFEGDVETLYFSNESDLPSKVTGLFYTDVEMPQVHDLVLTAGAVILIYFLYFLIRFLMPSASIISTATAKEAISQPLFILLTILGVVALIAFVYIPYNTFGEDVKMLKTSGMTTIKVLAIISALWTASVSIADEIEGRTALTVLSKPVGRRQFILGKFMGIVWPILLMFLILGIVFLLTVSFKVVYDARESSKATPEWQMCYAEVVRIVPGLLLSFMEAVVMASISVAISTRLPMLPNLVICGSIYVLGHLVPLIVNSALAENVFVKFIGNLIGVLLPVLDHYEIEGAIAGSSYVPSEYLGMALLYSAIYCTAAMLLALILFEDRDLA